MRNVQVSLGWGDQTLPSLNIPEIADNIKGIVLALPKGDWLAVAENAVDWWEGYTGRPAVQQNISGGRNNAARRICAWQQ
jgi:hypothetical protein